MCNRINCVRSKVRLSTNAKVASVHEPPDLLPRFIIVIIIRQPLCPVVGRRPQHAVSKLPYCAVLCHIVSLQYLSRSSLHHLAGLPCRLFLSYGLQVVAREVHRLSLRRLICPVQDNFIFLTVYTISITFVLSPDPDVGPSIFVCDAEHISFHFGLCGRKFVLCLFGQCPGLCTICHSWQHTGVVHLTLQPDGKVAFEDIPVFSRSACHDSSSYLFVLVIFLEAMVLFQVHVTLDIYQHIFHVIGVLSTTITFVFAMFILRPIRLLSWDSYCSICCCYCGVSVHRNMSSATRRLEKNYPSIATPLFSQFNLLSILSNVAVNSFGEMVSPCLTLDPDFLTLFVQM